MDNKAAELEGNGKFQIKLTAGKTDSKARAVNTPDLVQEYNDFNLETLIFFGDLEICLRNAKFNPPIMRRALAEEANPRDAQRSKVLEELKTCGNHDEFHRRHIEMHEKIHAQRSNLCEKLKLAEAWRMFKILVVYGMLIGVTVSGVSATVQVAADYGVVALPIIFIVGCFVAGGMRMWWTFLSEIFGNTAKNQLEVVDIMYLESFGVVKVVETIKAFVDRLESTNSSVTVEDMKLKNEGFKTDVEDLLNQLDRCSRKLRPVLTYDDFHIL